MWKVLAVLFVFAWSFVGLARAPGAAEGRARATISAAETLPPMASASESLHHPNLTKSPVSVDWVNANPPSSNALSLAEPASNGNLPIGLYDVLSIRSFHVTELTGEYTVRGDGTISLPLAGVLEAAGATERQIENRIAELLQSRPAAVSVEITKRNPIFVTGDVERPGSYTFFPNATVKHAVALAGGIFRIARTFGGLAIEATREVARQHDILVRLKKALAQRARLEAEIEGRVVIRTPKRLKALAPEDEVDALIEAERQILLARKQAFENRMRNLTQEADFTKAEINAKRVQRDKIEEQIKLNSDRRDRIDGLLSKGIVNEARFVEIQTLVSRLEGEWRNVDGLIAASQRNLVSIQRQQNETEDSRASELAVSISGADAQIKSLEYGLMGSQGVTEEILGEYVRSSGQKSPPIVFFITRADVDGRYRNFPANELTILRPGDVLDVRVEKRGAELTLESNRPTEDLSRIRELVNRTAKSLTP